MGTETITLIISLITGVAVPWFIYRDTSRGNRMQGIRDELQSKIMNIEANYVQRQSLELILKRIDDRIADLVSELREVRTRLIDDLAQRGHYHKEN